MNNVLITIISSLISGLIGIFISNYFYKKSEKNKLKMQTFRKIVGYRYCIADNSNSEDEYNEFFSALNEVFVVFNEDKEVIAALKKMHEDLGTAKSLTDNLVNLIRRMSEVLGVNYSIVNDSFFERPFRISR